MTKVDDDPPFFDIGGWLAGELEADMAKVFKTCANMADTAIWGAKELREIVDIFTGGIWQSQRVEILDNDFSPTGSDIDIRLTSTLDDEVEMWASMIKKLCERAAALDWATAFPAPGTSSEDDEPASTTCSCIFTCTGDATCVSLSAGYNSGQETSSSENCALVRNSMDAMCQGSGGSCTVATCV